MAREDTNARIVLARLTAQDDNLRQISESLRCHRQESNEFREEMTDRVGKIETAVEVRAAVAEAEAKQRSRAVKALAWIVGVLLTLAGILVPVLWGKL